MSTGTGFGRAKSIDGKAITAQQATAVPLQLLSDLKRNYPIPITIGGTSGRTFTINASKTNPVRIWNGNDYMELKETLAYSWVVGSNAILHATTGAETTLTNGTTGVWYMYLGLTSAGAMTLIPSAAVPSYVEGPFEGPVLGHPGTARTQFWNYVGFMLCDATTPTFIAATKTGFTYEIAEQAVAITTVWALLDFSLVLPAHGVEAGGYVEAIGSGQIVKFGTSSTASQGAMRLTNVTTTVFVPTSAAPFSGIVGNSAGKFYAIKATNTRVSEINLTRIKDVV